MDNLCVGHFFLLSATTIIVTTSPEMLDTVPQNIRDDHEGSLYKV